MAKGGNHLRKVTHYAFPTKKLTRPVKLAIVSDLHNEPFDDILPMLEGCDGLLVPGDVANRYRAKCDCGVDFLREASKMLPTFYSVGNHELRLPDFRAFVREAEKTDAEILINRFVPFGELVIGGWYAPHEKITEPDMLEDFENQPGFRLLMCHKPHHAVESLMQRDIDLIVSGHAHGGQIRFFGQGVYAPGQGLFPKYTKGLYHNRLLVSAGCGNPCAMPRWFNPGEVLMLTLG